METLAWVVPMVTQEGKEETDTAAAASTLFFIKVLLVFTVKLLFLNRVQAYRFSPRRKGIYPGPTPPQKKYKIDNG
jgi:hypothetical protein